MVGEHTGWKMTSFKLTEEQRKIIAPKLMDYFNGDNLVDATEEQDKNGTDYYITNKSGLKISVDVKWIKRTKKIRSEIPILLELEHLYKGGKHKADGWSKLLNKNTNYICYYYSDLEYIIVLPFIELRNTTLRMESEYKINYQLQYTNTNNNGNVVYFTSFILVPYSVFIKDCFNLK